MSHYIFKGRLCGYICAECPEPLANLQVRLYRVDKQRNVAALAVANPKETFAILDDDQVQGKESRLLAMTTSDAEGNFTFELGENYAGEAFEVDVYCGSVPRQKIGKNPPKPRQFTITTLQPRYRETENGFIAVWDYCLPYRFWCAVLSWFDVWTICGRVLDCERKRPIAGAKVMAFDADWLADDALGFAFTDAAGKFLITYSSVDFRQGTWIDVELIGGPDLYFRIEDSGGNPLLTETQAHGRTPARENATNCFCVELCIEQPPLLCEITKPGGCAVSEYDAVLHKWIIRVEGTASGAAFGNYTLSVERGGFPFPMPVIYPGGGSTGTVPVVSGELGLLDVTGVQSDAYKVILTVNPANAGSPCVHDSDFDFLRKTVSITAIGGVSAQVVGVHPLDASEPLKLVKINPDPPLPAPPEPEASVGRSVSVWGTADYYGCGRQMSEYVLQYKEVAFGSNPWQQDAPDPWVDINGPLPFGDATHPRVYDSFWGQIDNFVRTPNFLTRSWVFKQVLQSIFPMVYDGKWITEARAWGTDTANLNGRYTVRVRVQHQPLIGPPAPIPPELYDAATVWLDNRAIEGRIIGMAVAGGGALGNCDELLLSQFISTVPTPHKLNAEINGRAWDPVVLDSYVEPLPAPHTIRPNDNFANYTLQYKKNGDVAFLPIVTSTARVPNILQQAPLAPYPADIGLLHLWDIVGALDAGPLPSALPPLPPGSPKIYRGKRCAYLIELYVRDSTRLGDSGDTHWIRHEWPFCIMNDLPNGLAFPVPE